MENISVRSLGPIKIADINFGDLTFFVGPQASGKSILLQLIKLITDKSSIETKLENYGFVWGNNLDDNMERFFGEGMSGLWDNRTDVAIDGVPYHKSFFSSQKKTAELSIDREQLFYIPAQRVLCLNFGWPRFFKDFDDSVPYVLRDFSETLRQYVDTGFSNGESPVFPQKGYDDKFDRSVDDSIFHGGKIRVELSARKRFKMDINDLHHSSLPFMAWSTGQKEFMPLLLGFYWLKLKARTGRRKGIHYVVIEEPEMGLHPDAIKSVILQMMDLVSRGYRVIVSTHSPVLLEFAWAFNILQTEKAAPADFDRLFNIGKNHQSFFDNDLIRKKINTYFFDRVDGNVFVKDISALDAGNDDPAVAEWGGLSSFASRAAEIVSSIAAK
jgi:hypothetical protein